MSNAQPPVSSTPQLDLLRRLRVRDNMHSGMAMPFLEDSERKQLVELLEASLSEGITDRVQRGAHALLVSLGQRDAAIRFLTDEERKQLGALTKLGSDKATRQTRKRSSEPMSAGEFIASVGVVSTIAIAAYVTYDNPTTHDSALWVGVWGVLMGSGFIGDTRRRSSTGGDPVSAAEGFIAAVIWSIAGTAVVLLGNSDLMTPGWAAFLSYIAAGGIGRATLKIKDERRSS